MGDRFAGAQVAAIEPDFEQLAVEFCGKLCFAVAVDIANFFRTVAPPLGELCRSVFGFRFAVRDAK